MAEDPLLTPGRIGTLELPNRIIRASTSESMAGPEGEVTDQLIALYQNLARNRVGLIMTGHLYCDERGKYAVGQTGIHNDVLISGLRRLTEAVHQVGGRIFAQLSHAGSQSRVPTVTPLAPSPVPNPLTGQHVEAASEEEIEHAVGAFGAAARRALEAGFDGIHIHGAHGYLISEFTSPVTNRRDDGWGGSPEARTRFSLEVVRAVRSVASNDVPVVMKLGFGDAVPGGIDIDDALARARHLVTAGLDAIEVTRNLVREPNDSALEYVAVDRRRALADWLFHRLLSAPEPEAYFRDWAARVKAEIDTTVILVGGLRTTETMRAVLREGVCDFVALARPFIREPDLARQIEQGREGRVDCTSCNICLLHEGHHPLQCWRMPRRRLFQHAWYRLTGGFARAPVRPMQKHAKQAVRSRTP